MSILPNQYLVCLIMVSASFIAGFLQRNAILPGIEIQKTIRDRVSEGITTVDGR